jgi:hypothetical protein
MTLSIFRKTENKMNLVLLFSFYKNVRKTQALVLNFQFFMSLKFSFKIEDFTLFKSKFFHVVNVVQNT